MLKITINFHKNKQTNPRKNVLNKYENKIKQVSNVCIGKNLTAWCATLATCDDT